MCNGKMPALAPNPMTAKINRRPEAEEKPLNMNEPLVLAIKTKNAMIKIVARWVAIKYIHPAFCVSLFSYSAVTRKNEAIDINSHIIKNEKPSLEITPPAMLATSKGKNGEVFAS